MPARARHVLEHAPFANALAEETLRFEAGLAQHAAGRRIAGEVMGVNAVEAELAETVVHHGARRFERVTASPPGHAHPEPELGLKMLVISTLANALSAAIAGVIMP